MRDTLWRDRIRNGCHRRLKVRDTRLIRSRASGRRMLDRAVRGVFGRDGLLLEQVQFDVVVLDDDGGAARSIADELGSRFLYAQSGTYHLEFDVRESPGIAEYTIVVYGSAPDWVVPNQDERDALAFPVEVRPNAGTEMPGSDGIALANEAGHARAPLAQARDGVQVDDVACNEGHVLMLSPSGSPACVFADSVTALEQRGFAVIGGADSGEPVIATMELSDRMITVVSHNSDPTDISEPGVYAYWPKYSITFPENVRVGGKFEVVFDYRYITPNAEGSYENFEKRCEYSSCEEDSFDIGVPTYVDFSHELAEVLGPQQYGCPLHPASKLQRVRSRSTVRQHAATPRAIQIRDQRARHILPPRRDIRHHACAARRQDLLLRWKRRHSAP